MGTVVNRPGKWVDLCQGLKMPENPAIWSAVAMLDHFEKIQKLKDKLDGVPNFRRVPGYKVFCCGQPTKEGFVAAIEKACGDKWPKDGPIIWMNMRQEAIIYVNGNPVCARPPNKIGEYAELGNVTRTSVKAEEAEFAAVLKKRAEDGGGKIKVIDMGKKESEIEVTEMISLHDVIEDLKATKFPGLTHNRIPICNSASPLEGDFDALCTALIGTNVNCPVIVNCQVGLSRSTTGCVSTSSSGSSNSPPLSKVSSKPFPESTLISFAWTNTSSRRTKTPSSVVNSKLSGNSLPLSPQEMLPNVNATKLSTRTDLHPREPVSSNCAKTLPNPSSATKSWTMPHKLSSRPKSWTTFKSTSI